MWLAVPLLKQSNNTSIFCLSSVACRLGYAYRTPYATTIWAIVGLVKSLAIELGPHSIRLNALLPGIIEGPRIEKVISARAQKSLAYRIRRWNPNTSIKYRCAKW